MFMKTAQTVALALFLAAAASSTVSAAPEKVTAPVVSAKLSDVALRRAIAPADALVVVEFFDRHFNDGRVTKELKRFEAKLKRNGKRVEKEFKRFFRRIF